MNSCKAKEHNTNHTVYEADKNLKI